MDPEELDGLWDYGDPKGSEARFRDQLPLYEQDSQAQAEITTQIARTLALQRKFDDAHQTLDQALQLGSPMTGRLLARYHLERGRVFNSSGERETAFGQFRLALEAATEATEDFYAVDAAHMLAIAADPEDQETWNQEAIRMASESDCPRTRGWMGSLLNNLGWSLHEQSRFEEAYDCFSQALKAREEQAKPEEIRIAKWCVGRCTRSLGRYEEALEIQKALAASGTEDGYVSEEIAECLVLLGRKEEAQPHFKRAYEALSQDPWLRDSEPQRLDRLREMSAQ